MENKYYSEATCNFITDTSLWLHYSLVDYNNQKLESAH